MDEINVEELAAALAADVPTVLDVREDWEVRCCSLPGSVHIPLGELPTRLHELDQRRRIVVLCHHGMRSRAAQAFLVGRGFTDVLNLAGGIDAWARNIDPAMATY